MKITGVVKTVMPEEVFSERFKKRVLVVSTNTEYTQHISIEFMNEKCALVDNLKEGQKVEVEIDVRGREWISPEGVAKYFNTIVGWKINAEEPESDLPF